jgi:hypothetical protein
MILFKSLPADWADGIGYVSSTVMFEGVYPERTRWRAVELPMVPPPPTTMTVVFERDLSMLYLCFAQLCGLIFLNILTLLISPLDHSEIRLLISLSTLKCRLLLLLDGVGSLNTPP